MRGRVQRVSYRASTRREAHKLGITGRAVNQADGSVEVVAQGPRTALDALIQWLHKGPLLARVDKVDWVEEPVDPAFAEGFSEG